MILVALLTMVGSSLADVGERRSACEAQLATMQAGFTAERRSQLEGGTNEWPVIEAEPVLRACYRDRVVPVLKAAEADDRRTEDAFTALTTWGRSAQLMGFPDDAFAEEWSSGYASLTTAYRNGYAKALARCSARADRAAADRMTALYTSSTSIPGGGDALFPGFRDDIAKCLRGVSYLITVRDRVTESKVGTVSEITYVGALRPLRDDPEQLEGTGAYQGFIVASPNCDHNGEWLGRHLRLPVAGKLTAWAQRSDQSPLGGSRNSIQYILSSLDWPYKPFFFSAQDAIATGEDRETVAGLGTTMSAPFALTDPVTVHGTSDSKEGGRCVGTITMTTEARLERLGGR